MYASAHIQLMPLTYAVSLMSTLFIISLFTTVFFFFKAFKMYDIDENETVTKGEFRRVLESYCLPVTTEQFDGIIAKVSLS